jgi:hypothetical protein
MGVACLTPFEIGNRPSGFTPFPAGQQIACPSIIKPKGSRQAIFIQNGIESIQ